MAQKNKGRPFCILRTLDELLLLGVKQDSPRPSLSAFYHHQEAQSNSSTGIRYVPGHTGVLLLGFYPSTPRMWDVKGARDSSQGGEWEERQDLPSCQRRLCSERMMSWVVSGQSGKTLGTLRESPVGRWSPSLDPRNMVGGGGLCPQGCCLLRGVVCMGPSTLLSRAPPALIFSGCIGERNGNPLQYSCLENPRDSGVWWAAVYGVAQSRTRLKRLSNGSSSSMPILLSS